MNRIVYNLIVILFLLGPAFVTAEENFKAYPGAQNDTKMSEEASQVQPGTKVEVYTTGDSFDQVKTFYKNLYKEYNMPANAPNIGDKKAEWAFFLIDGGKDLQDSKHWMKIQRPYVGSFKMEGLKPIYSDIRDVTSIEVIQKSSD